MQDKFYKTRTLELNGTSYGEIYSKAKFLYKIISIKTKRRPYIRSAYFKKEKIFLDLFWTHLAEKNKNDRFRRLKQYACGLDLIKNSLQIPALKVNLHNSSEKLYRFSGINGNGNIFHVQIKENIKNGEKSFISVFP